MNKGYWIAFGLIFLSGGLSSSLEVWMRLSFLVVAGICFIVFASSVDKETDES